MNYYLRWPLILDGLISIGMAWILSKYVLNCPLESDRGNLLNVISSVISTCVSLAGFILAALTIIVTFKSNLKAKGITEADDALELILSSKHYDSIVSVFKTAIVEFILVTVLLYFVSATNSQLAVAVLSIITIMAIMVTSLSIWRSLFVLFKILKMEKNNLNQKRN